MWGSTKKKNGTEINDFLMQFAKQVVPTFHCNIMLRTLEGDLLQLEILAKPESQASY